MLKQSEKLVFLKLINSKISEYNSILENECCNSGKYHLVAIRRVELRELRDKISRGTD